MILRRRDQSTTGYQVIRLFSISLLPVSLPVGAWFVPQSRFPV